MKIKLPLLITLFYTLIISRTDAQFTFQETIDLGGAENAGDIKQTPDGGYVISGMEFNPVTSAIQVFLLKIDSTGSVQWNKFYSGGHANGANLYQNYRVMVTTEGDFVVAGTKTTGNTSDIYVIKTDPNGDTLWTRSYGAGANCDGNSIFEAENGDYIVGGSLLIGGQRKMGVLRIAPNGSLIGQTFLTDGVACPFYESVPLQNGNTGVIHTYTSLLSVLDSTGVLQWSLPLGFSGGFSVDAKAEQNGTYAILSQISGLSANAIGFVRTTSQGILLTSKKYSSSFDESPRSLIRTANGHYILFGLSTSMNGSTSALMACEVDTAGVVVWSNRYSYSSSAYHEASKMIATADGGYIMVGQHDRTGQFSDFDVYIVKTDASGQSNCNQSSIVLNLGSANPVNLGSCTPYASTLTNTGTPAVPVISSAVAVNTTLLCSTSLPSLNNTSIQSFAFPNPTSGKFMIRDSFSGATRVELMDISGKELRALSASPTGMYDVADIDAGIYFIRVTNAQDETRLYRLVKI
jgi:hypothetical protein